MNGTTLHTARLLLRWPCAEDFGPWADMLADPEATTYIGGPHTRAGARRNMALMSGSWIVNGFSNFSVIETASGRWIGRAGPWRPEAWPGPEIGWAFDRSAWGKGYATEAAEACMDWAFASLGWEQVVHVIDPRNTASIAVARRLGSARIGPCQLPPPSQDTVVDLYGQSRSDWLSRARRPPLSPRVPFPS